MAALWILYLATKPVFVELTNEIYYSVHKLVYIFYNSSHCESENSCRRYAANLDYGISLLCGWIGREITIIQIESPGTR